MKKCNECLIELPLSSIKNKKSRCWKCIEIIQVRKIKSPEYINEKFDKNWTKALFLNYILFLEKAGVTPNSIRKSESLARYVLKKMEVDFLLLPTNLDIDWFNKTYLDFNKANISKRSLELYFKKIGLINNSNDKIIIKQMEEKLNRVPKGFQKLLKVYLNESCEVRDKQLEQNARRILSLNTIRNNLDCYIRILRWLQKYFSHIQNWNDLQQNHVHEFLLTLTPKNREIVRKDFLSLFKLGKSKRLLTHIPILDLPTRQLPATLEPLNFNEQVTIFNRLKNKNINPLPQLLVILSFYHGLSSLQIREIKVSHVILEKKYIIVKNRSPVFLSDDEFIILTEYIKYRATLKRAKSKSHLFINNSTSGVYDDSPVNKKYVTNQVKDFCGYTPKILRITCLTVMASNFGPQLLVDAFGISLTQASRYGKLEDYLLEESINLLREEK